MNKNVVISVLLGVFTFSYSFCQDNSNDEQHHTTDKEMKSLIATAAANPVAHNMLGVPFKFKYKSPTGEYNRPSAELVLEPAIPFSLKGDFYLVTRFITPLVLKPDDAETGSSLGISNTSVNIFVCPPKFKSIAYGIGPALIIPTSSSSEFGDLVFAIGPALTVMWGKKNWVLGFIANQLWSYHDSNINEFVLEYFITHNFKKGWFINTTPTISANFNAEPEEKWQIPLGGGGGKIVHFPHLPIKFQLQGYYNYVNPTGAEAFNVSFTVAFLFSKVCY